MLPSEAQAVAAAEQAVPRVAGAALAVQPAVVEEQDVLPVAEAAERVARQVAAEVPDVRQAEAQQDARLAEAAQL